MYLFENDTYYFQGKPVSKKRLALLYEINREDVTVLPYCHYHGASLEVTKIARKIFNLRGEAQRRGDSLDGHYVYFYGKLNITSLNAILLSRDNIRHYDASIIKTKKEFSVCLQYEKRTGRLLAEEARGCVHNKDVAPFTSYNNV